MMHADDKTPPKDAKTDAPPPIDADITVGDAKDVAKTIEEKGEPFDSNLA